MVLVAPRAGERVAEATIRLPRGHGEQQAARRALPPLPRPARRGSHLHTALTKRGSRPFWTTDGPQRPVRSPGSHRTDHIRRRQCTHLS
eukprot:2464546-Pleurochrysis_carterae.AAC.1